ncbi:hypothetical protein RRG08_034434 [Elysia crispata]|uniref:HP domain-containing protein n=1 Tax=Elysia crispata TaxID=231223 RepID=A0AAE1CXA8_9GAST|nr:hypothetical protein RRG08_034434 [Elysia crispata]
MREKRLTDMSASRSGEESCHEPPGTYYGATLTSQLGGAKPNRGSIRSLECSRVYARTTRISDTIIGDKFGFCSRPTSAQSRGTTTRSRATSAKSIATSTRSDIVSAPDRVTPARSKLTSARSRVTSTENGWESTRTSTLCTSSLIRPMTSVAMTGTSSSCGRRSLRTRKKSSCSVASTGLTSRTGNRSHTEFNAFHFGMSVWLLEKGSLVYTKQADAGFFHQSNCYIVLQVDADDTTYLHMWHGSLSATSEQQVMNKYMKKMDLALEGASFLSIEHEGHETSTFLSHFEDGIVVVEGKRKQLVSRASKYVKRLYRVQGLKYPRAICCECVRSEVADHRVLILDGYPRMYVWMGRSTDYVLRVKAMRLAKKMRMWQRDGKGHIVVIDATEKHLSEAFMRKLPDDERGLNNNCDDVGRDEFSSEPLIRHLYRLNGDRVLYDMPLVARQPLQQKYLTSMDCYLLDSGPSQPIVAWVGNEADSDALYSALHRAQAFTQHHNYPSHTAVCRLTEGEEPSDFKTVFCWWRDRAVKERQLTRSYTIANIGRALYSQTDRRTVAKLAEVWSDDHFLSGKGTYQIWRVDGEALVQLAIEDLGVFFNRSCYIILHRYDSGLDGCAGGRMLYYWVGSKCSGEEELQAHKSACTMDASLGHTCSVLRVLDGKEPRHFFTVLQGSMIVYDSDLHSPQQEDDTPTKPLLTTGIPNMFCIREIGPECMRVEQVPPLTSYLNSSAAFLVISESRVVWYGKNAHANEREYAKNMLTYFCPERCRDYSIINEGKENSEFWLTVENNGDYPKEFCKPKLYRRVPTLTKCKMYFGEWCFQDIPSFSQEDLNETGLYILDSYDQVQIWCGSGAWDRDFSVISQLLKAYLDKDPCARCQEDMSIWTINQNYEPFIFVRHFRSWDPDGYGGQVAYQAGRKRLRQENARIDIECQMIDAGCIDAIKIPYKNLIKEEELPAEIDLHHKENHLSDADFARVMHQYRAQFYRLPRWKQAQILQSTRLTSSSCSSSKHEPSSSQALTNGDSLLGSIANGYL